MEDMCPLLTSGVVPAGRATGGPERLAATYARPGEATAWAVPKSKPANRGRSELTTDKTGFRRIVVKPHKAADLIEQPGGFGIDFPWRRLSFLGVLTVPKPFREPIDNGPGTFDLKPCSIAYYQVKAKRQSMVRRARVVAIQNFIFP